MSIYVKVLIAALVIIVIYYVVDTIRTYKAFKRSPVYAAYTDYALIVEAIKSVGILYISAAPIIIMATILVAALVYAFYHLFIVVV